MSAWVPLLVISGALVAMLASARKPSPIRLEVKGDSLVVQLTGHDGVFALCRTLRLPLDSIAGVAAAPRRLVPATGMRLPGTGIPGMLRAGSFGTGANRDFWLARRAEQVLVIQLKPGRPYRRVVLEVPDPAAEAERLRPLVGEYTGTFA